MVSIKTIVETQDLASFFCVLLRPFITFFLRLEIIFHVWYSSWNIYLDRDKTQDLASLQQHNKTLWFLPQKLQSKKPDAQTSGFEVNQFLKTGFQYFKTEALKIKQPARLQI